MHRNKPLSKTKSASRQLAVILSLALILTACLPSPPATSVPDSVTTALPTETVTPLPPVTPAATRPAFYPGELVDYSAQTGDTLAALAARFNTTADQIREANPVIPDGATTMPPGMPMEIPIYYKAFWGSPYQMIPDSQFVYGPALKGFDTSAFVSGQPGWLNGYVEYAADQNRTGAQIVDYVGEKFSSAPGSSWPARIPVRSTEQPREARHALHTRLPGFCPSRAISSVGVGCEHAE
jgi:hypothetical protein